MDYMNHRGLGRAWDAPLSVDGHAVHDHRAPQRAECGDSNRTVASRSDVSVVICMYTEDRWEAIVQAVSSVRQQTLAPREIILVVDHNPELLARVQREIPDVVIVANAEARGLSGGRNTGIAVSHGAIVAFLDDDAAAEPTWLEHMSASFDDLRVLGGGSFVAPRWMGKRPQWLPEEFYWVVGCSHRGLPRQTAEVRNPFGGSMWLRREVFDEIGGFANGIGRERGRPMGCEETELAIRARQRWPDRTFVLEPRARVHHRVTPERMRWAYFRSRCYAEGLSKAAVSRLVGTKDALSAERSYTYRTLPLGMLRGVTDVIVNRDTLGLARAGAIGSGLAFTVAGYLVGTVNARLAARRAD
jgi:GT2 family glycosyltransferase